MARISRHYNLHTHTDGDLHGDGDHGNPAGMEANVAGFPREWKYTSRDSRGDGKNLYGIPTEVQLYLILVH